ncbi:gamma-glutamyltransferase [Marinicella litoralis]|uniref:Gamma-glutamyltransferase n=1 Tax=Marinicella litoralis TaxID=644220 RepID=A0A4R6XY66_9GAMM|nr:gamma-glutamyltransferase [Marinicella litoralis]TDR23450.1 gamma-glutamyltransferase [Marinicella litoralis]
MSQSQPHAIAAGHPETAAAAAKILQQGGNAFDGVLAAMMMSFVAEPLLSSPGGGGFLLATGPEQQPKVLDFFSDTPTVPAAEISADQLDFYPIMGDFGPRSQEFHIGHAAAAVPGVPAGIFKAHEKLCSMPLSEIAAPAIAAARQGVKVNHQQAYVAMILDPIIKSTTASQSIFSGLRSGAVWKNPQLAVFLDRLSTADHDWFYQGEVAQSLSQQRDSLLQFDDFSKYQCVIREPLTYEVGSYQVMTNPEPSTGGRLIIEQLKRLKSRHDDAAVLEAMQHADDLKRNPMTEVSRGTTHMSVADNQGNLASLTLSNGEGNGQIVTDCGFMLNNFLGEEDINAQGFFNWIQRQRMQSMMSPTLITGPDQQYALGTGGSNRIKTTLFQVINHLLNNRKILKHAIEAPRMHFENGHLDIEPGFSESALSLLKKLNPIHSEWHNHNLYFGGVNAVQTGETVAAVGDFRRHGCGIVGH